ncbi:NUDIX hydrolase [Thermodesulfobacterium sp. TA1]|uniref:NUDIX domain-containing protein n=1 Tax=Thermodesulfobacterium sp. TA1 TaxID=2234087 RepID=UPI001231B92B|nr:NUDIX domain-containing protein [Thermodesulfobacterium sp. TA1]QER42859.1 NUDIX hydrolase [Thermodesulfobacterium sp. TA1]
MTLKELIEKIESFIANPSEGLPEEIFLLISRITPLINVDLLIKNEKNETLLTWREDKYYGPGWHVPGGIIRYKEKIEERINKVALIELGAKVEFEAEPLCINEIIVERKERGHFISLLYKCKLLSPPSEKIKYKGFGRPKNGEWMWHKGCPKNLIKVHHIYKKYIDL